MTMLQRDGGDRKLQLHQQDLESCGIYEYNKDVPSWEDPYEDIKKLTPLTCRKQLVPH